MSITLNHSVKETCKFMLSATAEIAWEEDKSYNLNLQIIDSRTRNPLSYNDTILEDGKGIVEIDFDHSAYLEDGIFIQVTAAITELPPPAPEPEPIPQPEDGSVPENTKNIVIETRSEKYRLFGLYSCLDHIDFQQNLSYSRQPASLTFQSVQALAAISLKEDYRLISIADDSVDLTYISIHSGPVTPKWDINIINNSVVFYGDLPDKALSCGFAGFCFKAACLILHEPSGLILQLPLILDNR